MVMHNQNVLTNNISAFLELDATKDILGYSVQQSWSALFLLNELLSKNEDIKTVIEIGTCSGGLSLFFGMLLQNRGGRVITFDINAPSEHVLDVFKQFNVEFYHQDIFQPESSKVLKEAIKTNRVLLFCDGGNKVQELHKFSSLLKPHDLLMGHDFLTEIFEQDLSDELLTDYELYNQLSFNMFKTRILSFQKLLSPDPNGIAARRKNIYEGWSFYEKLDTYFTGQS